MQQGEGSGQLSEIKRLGIDVRVVDHDRTKAQALLRSVFSLQPYRTCKFVTDALRAEVRQAIAEQEFDLVCVHFLTTLPVIPRTYSGPLLLDQHNADVRYWESFGDGPLAERAFARINQAKLRRLRSRQADRLDAISSVSEADAVATREWADCPVWAVPNGVDVDQFSPQNPASDADPRVVFVGSLDVRMNEEALQWFVDTQWPRVMQEHETARFKIVGRNPTADVANLGTRPGVDVVGGVPDVVPYYEEAAIAVAPFRLGGGTKLKILEALSMERALVTTPVGATGIDLTDGTHALIAQRDASFAAAVNRALASPDLRSRLGAQGRRLVTERYAWDAVMRRATEQIKTHLL
jgi:glycosyltransferase involved in cell wall biosynthesis